MDQDRLQHKNEPAKNSDARNGEEAIRKDQIKKAFIQVSPLNLLDKDVTQHYITSISIAELIFRVFW